MSKEWLKDREQVIENAYFRQRDRELIERLREQGRLERERQALGARLGRSDADPLPAELQRTGFAGEGLALLHLMPLVDVAWADRGITARERALVLALAEGRGVEPGTEPYARLEGWLDRRPDQAVFDAAYEGIRALLAQTDATARASTGAELVAASTRVAQATGGILGMAPISREERECLERIAELLTGEGDADQDAGPPAAE